MMSIRSTHVTEFPTYSPFEAPLKAKQTYWMCITVSLLIHCASFDSWITRSSRWDLSGGAEFSSVCHAWVVRGRRPSMACWL